MAGGDWEISNANRVFWQIWSHTFGKDVREDFENIREAGRFAAAGKAFSDVMASIDAFFTGGGLLSYSSPPKKPGVAQLRLDHLDSGLRATLGEGAYVDPEQFEEGKERFFNECSNAGELLQHYESAMEEYLHCEDTSGQARLKDEALRAGAHLVLLAHAFQAEQDGRKREAIFAKKLLEIITVTEGMQAGQLTRKNVYEGLRIAAGECKELDANTIPAVVESEFFLRGVA